MPLFRQADRAPCIGKQLEYRGINSDNYRETANGEARVQLQYAGRVRRGDEVRDPEVGEGDQGLGYQAGLTHS